MYSEFLKSKDIKFPLLEDNTHNITKSNIFSNNPITKNHVIVKNSNSSSDFMIKNLYTDDIIFFEKKSGLYSIQNIYGKIFFNNINVIINSKILNDVFQYCQNNKNFIISDSYTIRSIKMYIKICENPGIELDLKNITQNFLEFLNYLENDKIMGYIAKFLEYLKLKYNFYKNLNINTKDYIFINFLNYDNLPILYKENIYFISKWIEKNIYRQGKFSLSKSWPAIIEFHFIADENNKIILGDLIYDKYGNYIFIRFSHVNEIIFSTFYSCYFLWKVIRPYMIDKDWIFKFDTMYLNNIPVFIDIYNNIINNYHESKGFFIQNTEKQWTTKYESKMWTFVYINTDDENDISYRHLRISQYKHDEICIDLHLTDHIENNTKKFDEKYGFFNYFTTDKNKQAKKLWSLFKNKLLIYEKDMDKFQEIINYFEL